MNGMVRKIIWRIESLPNCGVVTEFDQAPINANDIESIAKIYASLSKKIGERRFALVMRNDLDFGQSRRWQALMEDRRAPFEIQVFREIEEAYNWLRDAPSK